MMGAHWADDRRRRKGATSFDRNPNRLCVGPATNGPGGVPQSCRRGMRKVANLCKRESCQLRHVPARALLQPLKVVFEAVRLPDEKGELVASASKGATAENRGTIEKHLVKFTEEVLDNIVGPLVKAALNAKKFKDFITARGM